MHNLSFLWILFIPGQTFVIFVMGKHEKQPLSKWNSPFTRWSVRGPLMLDSFFYCLLFTVNPTHTELSLTIAIVNQHKGTNMKCGKEPHENANKILK